ncbi:LANO_0H20208g1_1 [Lachancea nothofagi CBS 11611]|uniref:Protoporphyrinogen oxidase n=1 Tax=Lachancea nothofagi CBS 11611 TaxID=1266666 RepID=A0A1G4KN83_9SACH|nr:LANO_0H20208g1_1 [Lachancea nothofagi CBS 11611]
MIVSPVKLAVNGSVAVIGAGVGGLSFAYFLSKLRPDLNITIIEASDRKGGWINTSVFESDHEKPVLVEKGPRTLRGQSDGTTLMVDTLKALKMQDAVLCIESKSEANRKFLLDVNDSLVQVPNSLNTLIHFLSSSLGRGLITGLLGEPFRKLPVGALEEDESAHSLISRRFGNSEISNNIFSAIFHGIYAGDIKQLSAKRTLASIFALERKHGSLIRGMLSSKKTKKLLELPESLHTYQESLNRDPKELLQLYGRLRKLPMLGLRNGLETFPKALSIALQQNPKVNFELGSGVSQIDAKKEGHCNLLLANGAKLNDFDHIRLTNTPKVISRMIRDEALAHELKQVHANTVVLLNFYLPNIDLVERYHSFGYLVPQSNQNQEQLLGVIFDSVIEQNYKPLIEEESSTLATSKPKAYTKLTAMVGGHYLNRNGAQLKKSTDYIKDVKKALGRHLKISESELDRGHWEVTFASECLPQFFVHYDRWLKRIETDFETKFGSRVSLGGMAFSKGPGVPDVVMDGFEDAKSLS